MILETRSEKETRRIAEKLGKNLKRGLICLYGDLGAGKTTFVKGLAKGLGIAGKVKSPTFTYSRVHRGRETLYHFDCYRLRKADSIFVHEFHETVDRKDGVIAVEWAERIESTLPSDRIEIYFEYVDEETRKITIMSSLMIDQQVSDLIDEFRVPLHVRRHCAAVANFAVELGRKLISAGERVDLPLLKNAALLHDLMRVVDFKDFTPEKFPDPASAEDIEFWKMLREKYKGRGHEEVAAEILAQRGWPDIARLVKKHRYPQVLEGFDTWEEKLLYYADKRANHDKIVPLKERLYKGRMRNAPETIGKKDSDAIDQKIFNLEREIITKIGET